MISSLMAVFPGQGSQHIGMAKDLYDHYPVARQVFEEISDAIHLDLKKLCFFGTEAELTLTENTQPCLLAASVASFRAARKEFDFKPGVVAGHSLGEYSALVAAESLPLATAARWVRERGIAMQKAVPAGEGSMAAIIGLDDSGVEKLCRLATQNALDKRAVPREDGLEFSVEAIVEPANFNSPGQVVIAGSSDAIQEAVALVKSGDSFPGGKAIPLQVSAPFHCRLMKPARHRMEELFAAAVEGQKPKRPICPYVPNRTGRITQESGTIFEFLIEQVDHPVLWKQTISGLLESDFNTAIEFGPGKVLSGLIKRIAGNISKNCTQASVGDTTSMHSLEKIFKLQL